MNREIKQASILNIIANIFLFVIKLIVGLMFGVVSILGDAFNSLSDIITAIIVFFTVRINNKQADDCHPFGHSRAENIAGYTTGVLMILLSFTIFKLSFDKFMSREIIEYNYLMLLVVGITLLVKLVLYFYVKYILKTNNSPALKANMQDHLNDVILIIGVGVAIVGIRIGIWWIDPLIAFFIAIYVLKEGFSISVENIDFLMGKAAGKKVMDKIKKSAIKCQSVKSVNKVITQYLGNKIQVEIHIGLDSKMNIKEAHYFGNNVRDKILKIKDVNNCFVHIDPYEKNK